MTVCVCLYTSLWGKKEEVRRITQQKSRSLFYKNHIDKFLFYTSKGCRLIKSCITSLKHVRCCCCCMLCLYEFEIMKEKKIIRIT